MSGPEDAPEPHCACCFDWEQRVFALEEKIERAKSVLESYERQTRGLLRTEPPEAVDTAISVLGEK